MQRLMPLVTDTDLQPGQTPQWSGMPLYVDGQVVHGMYMTVHAKVKPGVSARRLAQVLEQELVAPQLQPQYFVPPLRPPVTVRDVPRPCHEFSQWYDAAIPRRLRYPVYVISKGRSSILMTTRQLLAVNVPHTLVVESQEFDEYAAACAALHKAQHRVQLLRLPFGNLGHGSIPARNWVWKHALQQKSNLRHWILDDNIKGFYRRNYNCKQRALCVSNMFAAVEDFVDRYSNVALAGFHYQQFLPNFRRNRPPITLNTRVYSCILVNNHLPFRWRGKYNEDTDLSLRALKAGMCNVLFNAFLIRKAATMTMPGGNTDVVYERGKRRLDFAESLQRQHPDVTTVVQKFGRPHHQVNYLTFRNNLLQPNSEAKHPSIAINEYGMHTKVGKRSPCTAVGEHIKRLSLYGIRAK
jgi:hypothetical protein